MPKTLAVFILAAALAACSGDSGGGASPEQARAPVSKLGLRNFSAGCGDFLAYAADALTGQYLQPFLCIADGPCPVFAGAPAATDSANLAPGSAETRAPTRVSSTNTQEPDVDEADIVKTGVDGHIYILSGRTLHILPAFPPAGLESRPLGTLDLGAADESFYGADFFLDETSRRAVVLGNRFAERSQSVNIVVDVSDPAAPRELARSALDGFGLEARRVGSRIHRVSRFDVPTPAWFFDPGDPLVRRRQVYREALGRGDQGTADAIKAEVRSVIGQRVNAAGADSLLPRLSFNASGAPATQSTLDCAAIASPEVTTAMGLALVDSFNTDGSQRAVSGIVNNAWLVYASAQNLYLAQSSFGWFFAPQSQQAEQTAIYQLALSATGAARYRGVGVVDGSLIGSYAMSEHDGDLRVASTESRFDSTGDASVSQVSVLRAAGAVLAPVGAVRGLAPGEHIRGVRFIGTRGYVVTFRQIDPLFTLDLSNPLQPRVTDELKIPGFSSYLMPLGDSYLLTIGRAGDEQQLNGQVGIQLFDVRNPAAIAQVAALTPEIPGGSGSYSAAEYDPHAFSYFPDSPGAALPGTLSVPLHAYNHTSGASFAGFLVVRVDPAATQPLRETGRISHTGFALPGNGCNGGGPAQSFAPCRDAIYAADPRRSLFMQDASGTYLYTLSALGLIASDALAPSTELGRRPLPFDAPPCCVRAVDSGGSAGSTSPSGG
jgi:hypothetical protein